MKKYVLLSFIFLLSPNAHSQPVGGTVWEKNSKNIIIFYDYHGIGLEDFSMFDYLHKNILNLAGERVRPLKILGEFPVYDSWFKLINDIQLGKNEFLGVLSNLVGQQFRSKSIFLETCEVREIIDLIYYYLAVRHLFEKDIYKNLYEKVKDITFSSLEDNIFKKIDITTYSNDIYVNLKKSYSSFLEKIGVNKDSNILKLLEGLEPEAIKSFIHVLTKIFGSALEINVVSEVFLFDGDIALFIGAKHGFEIEKILKYNGFKLKSRWKKKQLDLLRVGIEGKKLGQTIPIEENQLNWRNYEVAFAWML